MNSLNRDLCADWSDYAEQQAVITPAGEVLTYQALAEAADSYFPQAATGTKELVVLVADNSLTALIAYVACWRSRRAVMLQPATLDEASLAALLETYQPDWLIDPRHAKMPERLTHSDSSGAQIHSELAVLLSTSGSTGSPKQVRLSYGNLNANARAIAEYLALDASERPLCHLPMSYSYGLSVINSHLAVGATLLLTADSMMAREFWNFCKEARLTSLPGVPYHYEMLERLRFERMALPSLRTLTQAGGRLAPEKILHWRAFCEASTCDKGERRFIPMYGQTEASARISYLPWEQSAAYPQCIGVAIPGGSLSLEENGQPVTGTDEPGELVYRGPNVMMGYAQSRDELGKGAELEALHTGDIACRNAAGLFYIVGRKKRFIKLFGLRVSLDEVESRLRQHWPEAALACTGEDQRLDIWWVAQGAASVHNAAALPEAESMPDAAAFASVLSFHPSVIRVNAVASLPYNANGKLDYQALRAANEKAAP
ncbi:AMP-binding protein [Pokkaliibacter sp. CJK22405]|uniref:AMP-binding protein n=1 Tax=Pokkaliibacter sp. CJK22405 TaxID=3384615 RepID=UPI003985228E